MVFHVFQLGLRSEIMNRLELTDTGSLFLRCLKACLDWLALGGELKTISGHILVMDQVARPGFLMDHYDTKTEESSQIIMQLGSSTSWMFLVDHAHNMKEEDLLHMAANLALNG